MRITKEFRIHEVRASSVENAPFQIMLEGNPFRREEESSLTLDMDTCVRHNISVSLDLVGCILVCSFESHEVVTNNGYPDMGSLKDDDLQILSMNKIETLSPYFWTTPPLTFTTVLRTLKLCSFDADNDTHLHIMPCPLYQIVLELTEEEYEECKTLPPASVMKLNFYLA